MEPLKSLLTEANDNRAETIFGIGKTAANIKTGYDLLKTVMFSVLLFAIGIGSIVILKTFLLGFGFILFSILISALGFWNRSKEMKFLSGQTVSPVTNPVAAPLNEVLVDYVAGVQAIGLHAATFVLGSAGELAAPQNAILLTNQNARFVYVPMPGGDVTTAHTDIAGYDFMFAKKEIEDKLKALLSQGGLSALINTSSKNYSIPLSELKVSLDLLGNVVFADASGNKRTFSTPWSAEGLTRIKELFKNYIAA